MRQPGDQPLLERISLAHHLRQDGTHRRLHRAAVVAAHPAGKPQEIRPEDRPLGDELLDRAHAGNVSLVKQLDHCSEGLPMAHRHAHPRADLDARLQRLGNGVVERGTTGAVHQHAGIFHTERVGPVSI